MINPDDLKVGQCYFIVGFYGCGFKYPHMRTMFYIGKDVFKKE